MLIRGRGRQLNRAHDIEAARRRGDASARPALCPPAVTPARYGRATATIVMGSPAFGLLDVRRAMRIDRRQRICFAFAFVAGDSVGIG